ncbi:MAG: hypothetical protein IT260_10175 [Saprospiraceae bacterium]|nr:hypothetical protein [Saprospiraceae bacterium]
MPAFPIHSNSLIRLAVCAGMLAGSLHLGAQVLVPQHTLRLEASGLLHRHIGLAYDFQGRNKKSGPAIQLHVQQHNRRSADFFHGVRIAEYIEQIRDTILEWDKQVVAPGQWAYVGVSRPLPPLVEFRPVSTFYVKLGWSFVWRSRSGKWQLCLQPGVIGGLHRYYAAADNLTIIGYVHEDWPYKQKYLVQQRTVFYAQHRSMRLRQHAFFSLAYDVGVSRMLGKHLFVEARGMFGLTLNPPEEEYHPPAPARGLSARAALLLGYMF